MSDNNLSGPFQDTQTWQQRVLVADKIYEQITAVLQEKGTELPKTLRRPDIRLILENKSGKELKFLNPGDHSKQQPEIIPAEGDKKAVMVMLKGNTLEEQFANAEALTKKFNLKRKGLTEEFAFALGTDATTPYVDEAYGPAPFEGQVEKIVPLTWEKQDGSDVKIKPFKGKSCSYGARAATGETVFSAEIVIFVKGTGTIAECVEGTSMCIAVSSDWETGEISTRPIVPSVAQEFYGSHYESIPVVTVDPSGNVQTIDLKNGEDVIEITPPKKGYSSDAYHITELNVNMSVKI